MTDPSADLCEALIEELKGVEMLCKPYVEPDTYQLNLVERTTIAEHLAPKLAAAAIAMVVDSEIGPALLTEAEVTHLRQTLAAALRDGSEG